MEQKYSQIQELHVQHEPVISSQPLTMTAMDGSNFFKPVLVGPKTTQIDCPFCRATVKTSTRRTCTAVTHILALMCCGLCCCCLPYMMDSTRNIDHYCPNCRMFLGTYHK